MKLFFSALLSLVVAIQADSSPSLRGLQEVTITKIECKSDSECTQIQCFAPPCDENVCIDGVCTLQRPIVQEVGDSSSVPGSDDVVDVVEIAEESNTTITEFVDDWAQFDGMNSTFYGNTTDYEDDAEPTGEVCGPVVCSEGDVCCNRSCGYCVPPGGACTKEFCEDVPKDTLIPPEEEDNTTLVEGETDIASGNNSSFWFFVEGDECGCEDRCTICQRVFEICIQINCD